MILFRFSLPIVESGRAEGLNIAICYVQGTFPTTFLPSIDLLGPEDSISSVSLEKLSVESALVILLRRKIGLQSPSLCARFHLNVAGFIGSKGGIGHGW
jgi:hypothetical protein